jgi:hypothetical protein
LSGPELIGVFKQESRQWPAGEMIMGDSTPMAGEHHTQKKKSHAGNKVGMERKKKKDAMMRERNRIMAIKANQRRLSKINERRAKRAGRKKPQSYGFVGRTHTDGAQLDKGHQEKQWIFVGHCFCI